MSAPLRVILALVLLALPMVCKARAQELAGPPAPDITASVRPFTLPADIGPPSRPARLNPLTVLDGAGGLVGTTRPRLPDGEPEPAGLSVAVNVMLLLTVITLAPSIMLMTTCFVRILIVLSLLRQAIGVQTLPPAQVITGLALFMTLIVMSPTIDRVWDEAVVPYRQGEINDYDTLWARGSAPIRDYMFDQLEATGNWSSLYTVLNYRGIDTSQPQTLTRGDIDLVSLVPAYMLSELKVGFLMGFRVYLPFLVIDMVISTLLISMSMMMLPPVIISLPFKLLLFVLVDGWSLIVGSLLESFVREGQIQRLSAEAAWALPLLLCWRIERPPPRGDPPLPGVTRDDLEACP